MLDARHALAGVLSTSDRDRGRDGLDGGRGLRIAVRPVEHLLQLGVFPGRATEFAAAVEPLIGCRLPPASRVATGTDCKLYRLAHDQYWVATRSALRVASLSRLLSESIGAAVGSCTPLSDSRVRVAVAGTPVRELLSRLLAIDLATQAFAVGEARQTALHHTAILIERAAELEFELHLLRTYAQTCWECLIDAALPFGYDLEDLPA